MTAYRFRVKFNPDPTSLWRDIIVGADRTIAELRSAINPAVGLDQGHLWFVGEGEDYWDSTVKYQCPQGYEDTLGNDPVLRTERIGNAGKVTIEKTPPSSDSNSTTASVTSTTTRRVAVLRYLERDDRGLVTDRA